MQQKQLSRTYLAAIARRDSAEIPANGLLPGANDLPLPCSDLRCNPRNRCKSWHCPICVHTRAAHAEEILLAGLLSTYDNKPLGLRLKDHSLDGLLHGWELLRKQLQGRGAISDSYAAVVGYQRKTRRFHLHIALLETGYVHYPILWKICNDAGFHKPFVSSIPDPSGFVDYMVKNLVSLQHAPGPTPGTRPKLFTTSQGWPRVMPPI